jgi:DNA modification methylase
MGIRQIDLLSGSKKLGTINTFSEDCDIVLCHGDVLDFLKTIPSGKINLVVSSPPYNIGKIYEKRREFNKYLKWQKRVLKECIRVLRKDGSLCWEIGNYIENSEVFPLDFYFYKILKEDLGLTLKNRIIWRFGHGLHARTRFSGRYETVLWFVKSDDYKFNLDSVRIPQKYPGKKSYKGKNKGKPSGNPKGKNPSDVWDIVAREWDKQIWNIPNVKSNHPEKTIHPAQFPIELIERLVLALTDEDDWVFDPFMGVGSALIAGLIHNRKVAGSEKEEKYVKIAHQRILDALEGKLKKRPLGKPVYKPTGNEEISKIPDEWKNVSVGAESE